MVRPPSRNTESCLFRCFVQQLTTQHTAGQASLLTPGPHRARRRPVPPLTVQRLNVVRERLHVAEAARAVAVRTRPLVPAGRGRRRQRRSRPRPRPGGRLAARTAGRADFGRPRGAAVRRLDVFLWGHAACETEASQYRHAQHTASTLQLVDQRQAGSSRSTIQRTTTTQYKLTQISQISFRLK